MRILLDTKDLINLVERGKPIALKDFADYLHQRSATVVFCFTNVMEFSAPLWKEDDILKCRANLQGLESLPGCYLRDPQAEELRAAVKAFESGCSLEPIDPYVNRWDETLSRRPREVEMLVGYRLDDLVLNVWRGAPELSEPFKSASDKLRNLFASDRHLNKAVPKLQFEARVRDNFSESLKRYLKTHSVSFPESRIADFAAWAYSDPRRCPGLRLAYEVYHALLKNFEDTPEDSDIADFACIPAVPYVDAATMDRRMVDYCKRACKKLRRQHPSAPNYETRLYPSLDALLNADRRRTLRQQVLGKRVSPD